MILRRFIKHVTEQNWFAVGLDVLVVITGIFLGMQVTDWNEERKERQEENSYLQRLLVDMDRSLELQKHEVEVSSGQLDRIKYVIRVIEGDPNTSIKEFDKNLVQGGVTRSMRLVKGTMNELVSTGRLATISNQSIRNAVIELIENFERGEKTIERVNVRFEPFKVEYHRYFIDRSYNPLNKIPVDYDLEKLKKDETFLLISHNVYQMMLIYNRFHTLSYERTLTFRNHLATTLNIPVLKESEE